MLTKFILYLIALTPNHELNRDVELRDEVIGYFEDSAEKYDVDASWMIYYAKRESSLMINQVGSRGEIGYAQAHGKARSTCEASGHDPKTRRGGAMCMGLLMDMGVRRCGDFMGGMRWYASGSCYRAANLMSERYRTYNRLWSKLRKGEISAAERRKVAMQKYLAEQRRDRESEVGSKD